MVIARHQHGDSLAVSGISSSAQTESFNSSTHTATFSFTGLNANGILPDGNYTATVSLPNVADLAGNHPASTASLNFSFFDGDANLDHTINALDFNALASSYGQSGKTYSQGDFNYDGTVNSADFAILAAKFGGTLAAAGDVAENSVASDSSDSSVLTASATSVSTDSTQQSTVFSNQSVSQNLASDLLS